jgi:DNA invertase Pin-like site-specific DNA recombinase
MKCFAYCRVSGLSQLDGDGFPRQREAIETYARANDLRIVRWFQEKAVPGKTEWEDRPAWSEMVVSLNGVQTIIIEKLDRLARDLLAQEHIILDLQRRGINLVSVHEPDLMAKDPTRILMRQIMGSIAQYDRAMLVLKLRASRDRKKKLTGRCEGALAYGAPGTAPEELEVMERVRALRAEGLTWAVVANELNSMGYRTRPRRGTEQGAEWYPGTLCRLFFEPGRVARKREKK